MICRVQPSWEKPKLVAFPTKRQISEIWSILWSFQFPSPRELRLHALACYTVGRLNFRQSEHSAHQVEQTTKSCQEQTFFAHHSKIHKSLFYGKVLTRVRWREAKRPGMAKTTGPLHTRMLWVKANKLQRQSQYKLHRHCGERNANTWKLLGSSLKPCVCFWVQSHVKVTGKLAKNKSRTLFGEDLICEQSERAKRPDLYLSGQFRTQRCLFPLNPSEESLFEYFLSIRSCCLCKFMIY